MIMQDWKRVSLVLKSDYMYTQCVLFCGDTEIHSSKGSGFKLDKKFREKFCLSRKFGRSLDSNFRFA